jgi:hypothetical protein
MTFAEVAVQGIDLEFACTKLDNVVEDIESLKARIADLLDDPTCNNGDVLTPGSRFRKLLSIKALIYSMGIDAFSARRSVNAALAYQQSSLPNPEGIE